MPSSLSFRSVATAVIAVLGPVASAAAQTPRALVAPRATTAVPIQPVGPTLMPTTPLRFQVVVWQNGVKGATGGAYSLTNANGSAPPATGVSPQPQVLVLTLPPATQAAQTLSAMSSCVAPACRLEIDQLNTSGQVAASYLLSMAVRTQLAAPPAVAAGGPAVSLAFAYQVAILKATAPASGDDWASPGP